MHDSSQSGTISASLFDLDHTLLNVNISYKFGVYLYLHGSFSLFCMLQLSLIYALHKLCLLSMRQLHEQIFRRLFKGRPFEQIAQYIAPFLDEELPKSLNPAVFALFNQARRNHELTVILSSSPDFLVEAIAKRLEFSEFRGSLYSLDKDQRFCHISGLMQGLEKAAYISELRKRTYLKSGAITAYSDSVLDLPFLEAADQAVGVNPDRSLRKICKEKGWRVI